MFWFVDNSDRVYTHFAARCKILLRADSSSVLVMWLDEPEEELEEYKQSSLCAYTHSHTHSLTHTHSH